MSALRPLLAILAMVLVVSCEKADSGRIQGYAEGEYVYVASPGSGRLEKLQVERGQQVKTGDPLFELEAISEQAARDEAERRLTQAKANLEDIKKGRRPMEIAAMEAQIKQSKAAAVLSERELERQQQLAKTGVASKQELDRARSTRDQDVQRIEQLAADIETARMGARTDQVAAQEANVRALESALARAEWDLSQKRQTAPQAGVVFDTLYRQGEWVAAGRPVVSLLPPGNIKVRAFVPETRVAKIMVGAVATVFVDGGKQPIAGKVSYVSPQAEYTPPVIYSRESRGKLVFMLEIRFPDGAAADLHPGQPVDVEFPH